MPTPTSPSAFTTPMRARTRWPKGPPRAGRFPRLQPKRMHNKTFVVDGRSSGHHRRAATSPTSISITTKTTISGTATSCSLGHGRPGQVQASFDAFWAHPLGCGAVKGASSPRARILRRLLRPDPCLRLRPRKFLARDPGPHRWHSRGHTQVDCCRSVAPFGGDTFCL